MELSKKQKWILGGIATFIMLLFILFIWIKVESKGEEIDWDEEAFLENVTVSEETVEKQEEKTKIMVYVTGEVKVSGVVTLEEGSRVIDAINAAGGTTEGADLSNLNLAYIIEDGQKIEVPNKEAIKDKEYITSDSGDNVNSDTIKTNKGDNKMVNINTATQTELETIPGVGPSTALKILEYRKENGKFKSVEEIKNVKGIGDAKYTSMKAYITI